MTYAVQVSPGYSDGWSITMYGAVYRPLDIYNGLDQLISCLSVISLFLIIIIIFFMHQRARTGITRIIPIHSELPPYL